MINEIFQKKSPFVYNYFSNLFELVKKGERKFPQAIILEGADTCLQYTFALELARISNCKEQAKFDCNCTNCRWIKNFEHPCVNNVSQIHFKPDDDESKTVISVKQAAYIEKTLSFSSDYHRFFIFFSSNEVDEADIQTMQELKEYGIDKEINFTIKPLEYKTFNIAALNALLKSVEEPPDDTTFVFLTKSKEDILPTIVSRCLVFKISGDIGRISPNNISSIIGNYFDINYENAFDISNKIANLIKEDDILLESVLNMILAHVKDLIKANINNNQIYLKLNCDVKYINEALKQSKASMSEKIILDTLFLKIARGANCQI